jgi:hypothetical protein
VHRIEFLVNSIALDGIAKAVHTLKHAAKLSEQAADLALKAKASFEELALKVCHTVSLQ